MNHTFRSSFITPALAFVLAIGAAPLVFGQETGRGTDYGNTTSASGEQERQERETEVDEEEREETGQKKDGTGQRGQGTAMDLQNACDHIGVRLAEAEEGSAMYERLLAQQTACEERASKIADCRKRFAQQGPSNAAFARECLLSTSTIPKVARMAAKPRGICVALRASMIAGANSRGRDSEVFADLQNKFQMECSDEGVPVLTVDDPALTEEDAENLTSPFTDTADLPAVHMYARGIFSGVGDTGRFAGDQPTNRAQVAKVLFRACGLPENEEDAGGVSLSDVPENEWYAPFVQSAMKRNIIGGYPDGTFKPAHIVNRAEFAKMFVRACNMEENLPHGFADVRSDDWFDSFAGAVERYNMMPDAVVTGRLDGAAAMSRQDLAIAIDAWLRNR